MSERIPKSWKLCQLSSVMDLKHGYQFRTPDFCDSGVKVVKIGQILGNGRLDLTECKYIAEELAQQKREFLLCSGDILISLTGNIGRVGIVPEVNFPLIQNYRVGKLIPRVERVERVFLSHLMASIIVTSQLNENSNSTAQANFGKSDVDKVTVSIPPITEQKKIASILTSVDEVIENTQKQIDKLQDLKKATMNELLTKGIGHTEFKDSELGRIPKRWEVKRLGDVSKIYFSNVDKKSYINEIPVFLCNYMDVYNNSCIKNGIEFMRATAKQREIDKFLLLKDDVIITKDSETPDDIAVSAYVSEHLKNVLCGYHLALIRSDKKKLSGLYLAHLFELDDIQHRYYQLANGSTRFGLTSDAVLESSIPVPPLREQKKIASILTSMDTQIQERERKLEQTQSLKKSLMQDLLAGKVRVKVN